MPQESQYAQAYKARKKSGQAKPQDNNSITVEGAIDKTEPEKFPKVPPTPEGPYIPHLDDPYRKMRTSQA